VSLSLSPEKSPPAGAEPFGQPLLFQWLRWRLLHNAIHGMARSSVVRPITIALCSLLVWVVVYLASAWGFAFLQSQNPNPVSTRFVDDIAGTLFDLLFLALMMMLIFSTGIILYSSLFGSAETAFLLSTPARADQVFASKFQGAVGFSSWAFILLGSPILIAYGVVLEVPWYFYVLLPLFFLGFVLVPGSLGALACLLIVNFIPKKRKQVLLVIVLVLLAAAGFWMYQVVRATYTQRWSHDDTRHLLSQFAFAKGMLVPSHWVGQGLMEVRRDLPRALYYLTLVWSNGLFLYVLTAWSSTWLYRRGFNRVATGGALRQRYGGGWMDRLLSVIMFPLDPQTRLLIVKDFRTFRRDPAQWAQVLIFTALLSLYFANTRRFYQDSVAWNYRNAVSLLNLCATALLLCTYTGRFIFPMFSLEGRKFWILGLLPLKRERLLWGKFAFSAGGGLLIAEFLVLLSDLMLNMPGLIVALHVTAVAVLALGLSGLSVGLGACLPNFRESDPSKIAVGFGGTLNLVACVLFLLLVICLMAAPWHLQAVGGERPDVDPPALTGLLLAGAVAGVLLGVGAVVLPLRLGVQALRRMEF
jgi:ABC-2 type transport system permease protein